MLLIEGDTELPALELNGRREGASGYIVDGDLVVEGTLESSDDDVMALLVTGSVHADVVFSSGADTAILGDLTASRGVVGHYNHGYLNVAGRLTTPWLVNHGHQISWGELDAVAVDLYSSELRPPYTRRRADLVEGIWDPEYEELDFSLSLELIRSGRPFLDDGEPR